MDTLDEDSEEAAWAEDLKAVLDAVYDGARSELTIYDEPPEPPLSRSDAAWAKKLRAKAFA